MSRDSTIEEDHQSRSNFVRELVQETNNSNMVSPISDRSIPKRIIQFWDNLDQLPSDVEECITTWRKVEKWGVERLLFDNQMARDFIQRKLGLRYLLAYDKCYHPAMQSDYFRLCYIFVEGGCYIDADDVFSGTQFECLFNDERLKIQPLCYDISSNSMVASKIFTEKGTDETGWIFYFNNNPLIAGNGHPLIERALLQATFSLEESPINNLPEIQSTTGPGNLTKSIFDAITENNELEQGLMVLCDWENIAKSKWELSYRNDNRNWRLSNNQSYKE